MEDRDAGRLRFERDVAVPLVGDAARAVHGTQLEELRALTLELEVRVRLQVAEQPSERDVLVGGEVLLGKEQHEVVRAAGR